MNGFVKGLLAFLVTWCFCLTASAQFVQVNAQLVDGSGALSSTSFLRFSLYNCGSNLPVYSAGNLVMIKKQFDLKPNAQGTIIGSVVPNDKILCGGVASTLWTITPMKDALTPIQPAQQYDILSSNGIFNLATAMPTNPALAPPGFVVIFGNPTLSQTINQPAGTTMTFLGTFDFTQATVLGLAPSGGGGTGPFSPGTTPCIPYYTGTANNCDVFLQTDGAGNELATSVTASSFLTTPLLNTTGTGYVKVFKTQSTPCSAQTGFMCWYGSSLTNQWTCLNSDGSSCNPGGGGGGSLTTQLNGTPLGSRAVLNLLNPPSFNGIVGTWTNPGGGGNAILTFSGSLDLATQTHNSVTVNGQTCTLGSSCSVTAGGTSAIQALTGDGSDGSVTADGTTTVPCLGTPSGSTYTMTRDCYFTNFTVNSGVTIKTQSNRIFASISITNSGTIQNAATGGGIGGNATGTNKSIGGTNGSNSLVVVAGSLASPLAAIAGKTGANGGTGAGSNGINGSNGNNTNTNLTSTIGAAGVAGGNGGTSGASGGNNAGGTGGTAGTAGPSRLANSSPREISVAASLYDSAGNALQPGGANGGSGSGAAGGGDGTNSGGGGGGSGGGGGQGGFIVLISPTITLNSGSVMNVSGGAGGIGGSGGTPTTGNCGGGGGGAGGDGGNGGIIVRIFNTLNNSGTDNISAGTPGTGGAAGSGVGTGSAGTAGANGNSGNAGLIYNVQLN